MIVLDSKSHHEKALKVRFVLDWVKISQDTYDPVAPYETRHDKCNGRYVEKTFYCPRVEFSYKGRRHFCYVPVKIKVDNVYSLFYNYTMHSEDLQQMEEALCEILTQFVEEN